MISNTKKIKHVCNVVLGTQAGIWSFKFWRLYLYCSDRSGWHYRWLSSNYDRRLYGRFVSIHTAFGAKRCCCC